MLDKFCIYFKLGSNLNKKLVVTIDYFIKYKMTHTSS